MKGRIFFKKNNSFGFTFIELLVVMLLATIVASIGAVNFKEFDDPLKNDVASLKGFIGKIKLKSMSHTKSYKVVCDSSKELKVYSAKNCESTVWNLEPSEGFKLSKEVEFLKTGFNTCFNSRGFLSDVIDFELGDNKGKVRKISVMLGGAIYEEKL